MVRILETRKLDLKNGKPSTRVRTMIVPENAKPKLKGRGKGERFVYDRLGPAEIGPGTRIKK